MFACWLASANNEASKLLIKWCSVLYNKTGVSISMHNVDQKKGSRQGFFLIVAEDEHSQVWVADGSHKQVHLESDAKQMRVNVMEIQLITISEYYVFYGHSYM